LDDRSRVTFTQYVVAPGESFQMAKEFLACAWGADPRCPIQGMPRELNCDFGPVHSSEAGKNLMASLGVAFTDRMPESPNVTGKVERTWRTLFTDFETTYQLHVDRTLSLRELNEEHAAWQVELNDRKHPDFRAFTRIGLYRAEVMHTDVRFIPEDLGDGIWQADMRCVDAFARIRWQNAWYRTPDSWQRGTMVEVMESAGGKILLRHPDTGETFDAPPATPTEWGQYRGHKDTPNQRLVKEAATLQIKNAPFSGRAVVVNMKPRGKEGEIASPFTAHESAQCFANEGEALDRAREIFGVDAFLRHLDLPAAIRELARAADLNKAIIESGLLNLRERMA
jgi:hypothetical protein